MIIFEILLWLSVFILAYHMFLHPLFLVVVSRFYSNKTPHQIRHSSQDDSQAIDVDIVIAAFNEADCIAQKLANLNEIEYPKDKLHIHLGLDGCTDNTFSIVDDLLKQSDYSELDIQVYNYSVNMGKIAVINDIMTLVSSDFVFFSDASALLPSNIISQLLESFDDPQIGAVSAGYKLVKPGQQGESSYWNYQTQIKQAESRLGSVIGAHGSCYAIRRALYEPLASNTINDDFILPMKIISQGYRVHYDTRVVGLELEGSSSKQDFNRRKRLSMGNLQQVFECADILSVKYGWTAFNFLSGKVIRALFPSILAIIFFCSLVLSFFSGFYTVLLVGQTLLYGVNAAFIKFNKEPKFKPFYLVFYLTSGYIAGLIGTLYFLNGRAEQSWRQKTENFVNQTFIHPLTKALKRMVDIMGASIGLLITLPITPFLALAIKLTSKGPIIYQQERVGLVTEEYTHLFNMYKFRSMTNDAEQTTGAVWATENDPRLTAVGKFMRKTRLDEIPQFINVLKGDMSLIGPRPERPCIATNLEQEIPFYLERTYGIIPGITGLAQVYQGYDQTIDDVRNKLNYDLAYSLSMANPWSWLKMECRIIVMTIWVMISGRGQ